jgi:hypothetical protein
MSHVVGDEGAELTGVQGWAETAGCRLGTGTLALRGHHSPPTPCLSCGDPVVGLIVG